jgi:phycocyanobilin:ferredoxin oxidoreductase
MIWRCSLSSDVWQSLVKIQSMLEKQFQRTGTETKEENMDRFNRDGWINRTWTSNIYRRAHIDVVDAREEKGLWMMHCCIFPHLHSNAPIFGLDMIAGKRKITGFFHDYSPTTEPNHPMVNAFDTMVSDYNWKKERALPDWAKAIFTDSMVAAGNVSDEAELAALIELSSISIDLYLQTVGLHNNKSTEAETIAAQNRYAHFQKQNPHTPRTMKALGLDEEDVDFFVQKCLFPDI